MKALPKFIEESKLCKMFTAERNSRNMISSNYIASRQLVKNRMRIIRILKNRNKRRRKGYIG